MLQPAPVNYSTSTSTCVSQLYIPQDRVTRNTSPVAMTRAYLDRVAPGVCFTLFDLDGRPWQSCYLY